MQLNPRSMRKNYGEVSALVTTFAVPPNRSSSL
ncbi:MAG: hypothetical protein JWR44_3603 [Hymenobacter sp.]|jgi:hypothetical protein|nr:hypothetical protein [Hymenobacter sp.]